MECQLATYLVLSPGGISGEYALLFGPLDHEECGCSDCLIQSSVLAGLDSQAIRVIDSLSGKL